MPQLTFLDPPIEQQFRTFHAANPWVYEELRSLALDLRRRGRTRYGIKGLWEVMRWHRVQATSPDDEEPYRLNNNYTAYYARLLMEQEPELKGFFSIRERKNGC